MRRIASAALLALVLSPICPARPAAAADDEMDKVWPAFQAAVAANDKEHVTALMRFPLQGWDENDLGTEITKDEFLKSYARAFTPTVKRGIATSSPKPQTDGSYTVEWHAGARHHRYTLIFESAAGEGFRCVALATGE
jgi:hypothetical protein